MPVEDTALLVLMSQLPSADPNLPVALYCETPGNPMGPFQCRVFYSGINGVLSVSSLLSYVLCSKYKGYLSRENTLKSGWDSVRFGILDVLSGQTIRDVEVSVCVYDENRRELSMRVIDRRVLLLAQSVRKCTDIDAECLDSVANDFGMRFAILE